MNLESVYEENKIQFGKLFGATWSLYKTHFISIFVLTFIGILPSLYAFYIDPAILAEPTLASFLFNAVIGGSLGLISYMSIMNIVDDSVAGRYTGIIMAIRKAVSRLPIAVTTGLLTLIMLLGWFLLLIIPCMIKSVRYSFTIQAVAIRKVAHLEAVRYSVKMVDDYWWTVVIAGFLIGLPGFILSIGAPFILSTLNTSVNIQSVFLGVVVVHILTTSFWYVGETLLFLALEGIKTNSAIITTPSSIEA